MDERWRLLREGQGGGTVGVQGWKRVGVSLEMDRVDGGKAEVALLRMPPCATSGFEFITSVEPETSSEEHE